MTIRSFALATSAALVATASIASAAQFAAAPFAPSGPTMSCTVPNSVSCKISSTKGLKLVQITANTPQGTVALVDKTYDNCPKQVTVGWDSAYQMAGKKIVECGPMRLKIAN